MHVLLKMLTAVHFLKHNIIIQQIRVYNRKDNRRGKKDHYLAIEQKTFVLKCLNPKSMSKCHIKFSDNTSEPVYI